MLLHTLLLALVWSFCVLCRSSSAAAAAVAAMTTAAAMVELIQGKVTLDGASMVRKINAKYRFVVSIPTAQHDADSSSSGSSTTTQVWVIDLKTGTGSVRHNDKVHKNRIAHIYYCACEAPSSIFAWSMMAVRKHSNISNSCAYTHRIACHCITAHRTVWANKPFSNQTLLCHCMETQHNVYTHNTGHTSRCNTRA
jgi:hypothetical protein